jgi:hypothetical protein
MLHIITNYLKITTAFPFIFAFILGRGLQNWLNWRLEMGVNVLSFAYISRSFTLGSTYVAPFSLRTLHWIPLLLGAMWAFSPFGSQAALRFTSVEQRSIPSVAHRPAQYIYPHTTGLTACGDCEITVNAANALMSSSLLSADYNQPQPQDAYGNLKIPALDSIHNVTGPEGWISVDAANNISYSSLLGIPFTQPDSSGNVTFEMATWYWRMDTPNITHVKYKPKENSTSVLLPLYYPADNSTGYTAVPDKNQMWQFAYPVNFNATTATSIPLIFEQSNYGVNGDGADVTHFAGDLVPQAVNVSVACKGTSCRVHAVKKAEMADVDHDAYDRSFFIVYFLRYLASAFPIPHSGTRFPGVLEAYLADPNANPFSLASYNESLVLYDAVNADQLGFRLSQVLNTYWIAHLAGSNAAAAFNASDPQLTETNVTTNSTVTVYNDKDFFHINRPWLSVLSLAILLLLMTAVSSSVVTFVRVGTDAIDTISALTMADGRLRMEMGTTMDSDERIRMLKDVELRIGDAHESGEVGDICIGRSEDVGRLEKGRIYR